LMRATFDRGFRVDLFPRWNHAVTWGSFRYVGVTVLLGFHDA
jgi:hypothetical protein